MTSRQPDDTEAEQGEDDGESIRKSLLSGRGTSRITRRAALGLLAMAGLAGSTTTAAANNNNDDDDDDYTPRNEHRGLAQRVEALEEELDETKRELAETKAELEDANETLEDRSAALSDAFGNDFVEPGDTRMPLSEEAVADIEQGLAISMVPDAFDGEDFKDKYPKPGEWSPGESFAHLLTGGIGQVIDFGNPHDVSWPEPDRWFPDEDFHPKPDSWSPGESFVDTIGGVTADRVGEEAFPGDTWIGAVERGLAVSMSPEDAFPGDSWEEQHPQPDQWEPGETFANVLALNLGHVIDPEHEFYPNPNSWFPDGEFHPDPSEWFPEEDELTPGGALIETSQSRGPLVDSVTQIDTALENIEIDDFVWEPITTDFNFVIRS